MDRAIYTVDFVLCYLLPGRWRALRSRTRGAAFGRRDSTWRAPRRDRAQ